MWKYSKLMCSHDMVKACGIACRTCHVAVVVFVCSIMPGNFFPFLNEERHTIIQDIDQPALHIPEVGRGRVELVGVKHQEITNVWVLLLVSVVASNLGETEHGVILIGDNPKPKLGGVYAIDQMAEENG
jgi:hypothetical protein